MDKHIITFDDIETEKCKLHQCKSTTFDKPYKY